jgi:hypothetical protein
MMKLNKWTLALAALGLVSLTSAQAEEAKLVPVETALSSTSISGYVDTSAQWDLGTGNDHVAPFAFNGGKQDGFNVDLVDVNISKPLDPSVPWSAGYTVDLLFGPDSGSVTGGSAEYLRQAYVNLSAPIGNVPTFKIGRFDQLLGSESIDTYKNNNWTRSYGFSLEPTEMTGVLGHYVFTDWMTLDAGVGNTATTFGINDRWENRSEKRAESHKAYTGLLTLTAPKDWGFLADDAVALGVTHGQGGGDATGHDKTHLFAGGNFNTPLKDLKLGVAYDVVFNADAYSDTLNDDGTKLTGWSDHGYATAIAGYATYSWTEKLHTSARVDYGHGDVFGYMGGDPAQVGLNKLVALTGTISYDLWANVLTRLEVRWDHAYGESRPFGEENPTKKNSVLVAANVVYKF